MIDNYDKNDERVGLLRKLIIKYIQECYFSSAKFWLASCIEVMVRGNNTFFQSVITTTGLMPCLLYDIIYAQGDSLQILQLSFDILGELIKFNKANFLLLNYYFVDNNEFNAFSKKAISKENLVDSNVFLRSILLSSDYFNNCDGKLGLQENQYFSFNCKFCKYLSESKYAIFYHLIQIIKPDDINQTNISCINTALLILILNYSNGKLAEFLKVYIIYSRLLGINLWIRENIWRILRN
jgi:Trpc4-associated protein